ncbi:MAG: hypothetical protein AVDCRST_MAG85-2327, partial [uncultured Solirubrobacteraceae bacterium]
WDVGRNGRLGRRSGSGFRFRVSGSRSRGSMGRTWARPSSSSPRTERSPSTARPGRGSSSTTCCASPPARFRPRGTSAWTASTSRVAARSSSSPSTRAR